MRYNSYLRQEHFRFIKDPKTKVSGMESEKNNNGISRYNNEMAILPKVIPRANHQTSVQHHGQKNRDVSTPFPGFFQTHVFHVLHTPSPIPPQGIWPTPKGGGWMPEGHQCIHHWQGHKQYPTINVAWLVNR